MATNNTFHSFRIICLWLFVIFACNLHSQTYPISVTVTQLPPYTPFLSDFTTPGPDRLRITMILLDSRESQLQVKLRLSIKGAGLNIKSNPSIVTSPITLLYNTPITLTNNDLTGLFEPAQLQFAGISGDNLLKTGKLPEGTYTICAEVFHFLRDETPISNEGCSVAFLQELDPPDILNPSREVIPVFPQQLLVSWIPRHIGLFPVEYQLDIYEKIPNIAIQQIVELTNPLIRYRGPFLNYRLNPEDPQLQIGKEYIARVRVKDPAGRYTFKNDGYSPPYIFQYGKTCVPPTITETKLRDNYINITWKAQAPQEVFDLRYRYKDQPWQTISAIKDQRYSLPIKVIGGKYEFQVGSNCYQQIQVESDIAGYTLDRKNLPPGFYACGVELEPEQRSSTLLEELNAGDTISANGMRITITSASGNNGNYSGKGTIYFPMMGGAGIQCEFANITLNENYELIDGSINVTGVGKKILSDDKLSMIDGLLETMKTASDILTLARVQSMLEHIHQFDALLPDGMNDKLENLLEIINTTSDPDIKANALKDFELLIKEYADLIDEMLDADFQIHFVKNANQEYGFDGWNPAYANAAIKNEYEKASIAKADYLIPNKSLEVNKTDVVDAVLEKITDENVLSKIIFRTNLEDTTALPATRTGNRWTITLPPYSEKGNYVVLASYIDEINAGTDSVKYINRVAGMLKVKIYHRKYKNITLVPILGGNAPNSNDVQTEINKIFNQAVVSWSVGSAPLYDVPGYDGKLDDIRTGALSNYTAEMRNIISRYDIKDTSNYYLFITSAEGSGLQGFMPRGRNYGFIVSPDAKTIAHELAHGYGTLEHTFEKFADQPTGGTEYLMDYGNGTELMYKEWEMLQHPPGIIPWFQGDEEGQKILQQSFYHDRYVYFQYTGSDECYASITPSGQRINLPANAIASYYPADGGAWPKGSLTGFVIGKTVYLGWWDQPSNQFYGYAPVNDKGGAIKPYYTGISGTCITYAGYGNDAECNQTILTDSSDRLILPYTLGDSSKILTLLPTNSMAVYETGKGVKGPCGCNTGPCSNLLEKFKDHPYLQGKSSLRTAICNNPCLLDFPFLQYDHFPESESAWMDDFNKVFGTLLHIGMAGGAAGAAIPMAADITGSIFMKSITELVRLKGKSFIVGFTFDVLVQRGMHIFFDRDQPFEVDYPQAIASAVEATISLKSSLGETAVSAAIECFTSGAFDDGKIRDDFDVMSCAKSAAWAILVQGGIKGISHGIQKIPKDRLIDGLIDLMVANDAALVRAGPFDDSYAWKIYKSFNPTPLRADDIQHLFKTSRLDEATDTWIEAINDPAIQKTLLDEGFYLKFRKLEGVTNAERKEMLRELLARAKVDGDGGKKAVGEWGTKIKSNWIDFIGQNIEELTEAPIGYQFYYRDDQKFIRRINASDPNTPQLTVKYGKIVRAIGQVLTNAEEIKLLLKTEKNTAYF